MESRLATAADAEQLLDWMVDFNRIEGIPFERAPMAAALQPLLTGDPAPGRVIIGLVDGVAVGYAVLTFSYDLEFGGRDGWMTELYLAPEARGRGRGRGFVEAVAARARDEGVHALHLSVRPENAPALALYRQSGFQPWKRLAFTRRLR
jgi:ribosomal protein S18 acetylase RimI-like enzyme